MGTGRELGVDWEHEVPQSREVIAPGALQTPCYWLFRPAPKRTSCIMGSQVGPLSVLTVCRRNWR